MKSGKELLSAVLKTTQMEQTGIRSVLDAATAPSLRHALEARLREYNGIESEVYTIASQRCWELQDLDPALRFLSDRRNRIRLVRGDCDSTIADMMIQGSTKGMIRGLRNLHRYPHPDDRISSISQKLLDCQTANIRQMQGFL